MKRVLITGANSFVGTNIELWLDKSFDGPNKLFKVEIVRQFAKEHGHKIWISRLFNPFVWLGSFFLPDIPKMFADSYYVQEMSQYDFDYQVILFEESLKGLDVRKTMR